MLRLSRPLTLWLLWLAIALLPMRAWAAAVMPVAMTSEAVAALAAAGDAAGPASTMPCHGADEAGPSNGSACSHCDACHGATALLAGATQGLVDEPQARPRLAPSPGVERPVQSGPDRPPRSWRA